MKSIILLLSVFALNFCNAQSIDSVIISNTNNIDNFYQLPKLIKEREKLDEQIKKLNNKIGNEEVVKTKFEKSRKNIISFISKSETGEIIFSYKGTKYYAYVADLKKEKLEFKVYKNMSSISKVKKELESEGKSVNMICNAGMFNANGTTVGLAIQKGKQTKGLNTSKRGGNFFLLPNGVFYIDSLGGHVVKTKEYREIGEDVIPFLATQSGPMLIINGKHHSAFNYDSSNKNIRNGVGIMSNGKIVFLMSSKRVNLFEFGTVFKDLFGCKDALYLDGAISDMYLKKNKSKFNNNSLVTFISVYNKKVK